MNADAQGPVSSGETHERLLHAALDSFTEHGYANATIADIAHRAGVAESAAYEQFTDKETLYQELFERYGPVSPAIFDIDPEALGARDPHEALPELVEHIVAAWDQPAARQFAAITLAEGHPLGHRSMEEAAWIMHQVIDAWQGRGLLRGDVGIDQTASELFAPFSWYRLRYLGTEGALERTRQRMHTHLEFFLTVMAPPES